MTSGTETVERTADDEPEVPSPSRARGLALGAPAYLPALMIAIGGWQHRWMDEDAFINLRIVDQIFAGHGPVFNAGERVESATSALWLAILVVARLIFGSFASMEWITTLTSLAAAVGAFAVAGKAARVLHRGEDGFVVPVGLILVAAVAVVWDFSTSGLEMGLVWLWLAGVVRARVGRARRRSAPASGCGSASCSGSPPSYVPTSRSCSCSCSAWFVLVRPRRIVFDLVAIFALPVAYQIFRMGYYATVVPTTALAKDAGGLHLGQGWAYAKNFIGPYRLWLTAILIVATIVYRTLARRDRRLAIATAAMLAAGLVHALYITAIGGDYMHGRLLLPAFFALALPASIAIPTISLSHPSLAFGRRTATVTAIGAFAAVWAVVSVAAFRPPKNPTSYLLSPISDFRAASGAKLHPNDTQFGLNGNEAAALYARGVRGYFKLVDKSPRPSKDPNAFVLTLGFGRRSRVRRGPARLGRRHRRSRRTARGAHRAPPRPDRRSPQTDRRRVVRRAVRRDHHQPQGRGRAPRAHVRADPRAARRGRRQDDSRPVLLEHLAQRELHEAAHPVGPDRRRANVVQVVTTCFTAASAVRIASVTSSTGRAASTVTRIPRSP